MASLVYSMYVERARKQGHSCSNDHRLLGPRKAALVRPRSPSGCSQIDARLGLVADIWWSIATLMSWLRNARREEEILEANTAQNMREIRHALERGASEQDMARGWQGKRAYGEARRRIRSAGSKLRGRPLCSFEPRTVAE